MGHTEKPNVVSDKGMSAVEAAYVAGIVDGEGTLNLLSERRSGRKSAYFAVVFRIANTNLALLERIVEMMGNGRIEARRATGARQKICFDLGLTANQMRHVVPQIEPYLVAKRRHAQCVLRYFELKGDRRYFAEANIPEVLSLAEELAALNRRGVWSDEEIENLRSQLTDRCVEEGCTRRRYRDFGQCYFHWLGSRDPQYGKCAFCGGDMKVLLAHKRFCSSDCQQRAHRENVVKPRKEAARLSRTPGICPNCGSAVDRTRYSGKKFCNAGCYDAYRQRAGQSDDDTS